MQGRFVRISNNSSKASMIKHIIRNRMFVVKLHLSANQRNDIGRKPLNKQ